MQRVRSHRSLAVTFDYASLLLPVRGPLQRIHAPAAFAHPVQQKDRMGALKCSQEALRSRPSRKRRVRRKHRDCFFDP
jgi:hypothetical protein